MFCSRCKREKPETEFSPKASYCRLCTREYAAERRRKRAAGEPTKKPPRTACSCGALLEADSEKRRGQCRVCWAAYMKAYKRSKGGKPCACGCGGTTLTGDYCQGHNARRAEPGEKWCGGCDKSLPQDAFTRGHNRCRECRAEEYRIRTGGKKRETLTDEQRRLYAAERARLRRLAETPEQRERRLEQDRQRYQRNAPKYRAKSAKWREENPEKAREVQKRGNARRDRAKVLANAWNQKHRRRSAIKVGDQIDRTVLYEMYDGCCGICGEPLPPTGWDTDHIEQLGHGGAHTYENTRPAHGVNCRNSEGVACNQSRAKKLAI